MQKKYVWSILNVTRSEVVEFLNVSLQAPEIWGMMMRNFSFCNNPGIKYSPYLVHEADDYAKPFALGDWLIIRKALVT